MTELTRLGDPDAVVCVDGVCFIPGAAPAPAAAATGIPADAAPADPDPDPAPVAAGTADRAR